MIRYLGIGLLFLSVFDGIASPHLTLDYEWLIVLAGIAIGAGLVVLGRWDES